MPAVSGCNMCCVAQRHRCSQPIVVGLSVPNVLKLLSASLNESFMCGAELAHC